MSLLIANDLKKTYGDKTLLDDVSFVIEPKQRIGFIGANGTGKSTLLHILTGAEGVEKGEIRHANAFSIAYVDQEPVLVGKQTILDAVYEGEAPVMQALHRYDRALRRFQENPGDEKAEKQLYDAQATMEAHDAWEAETSAKTVLTKLGLHDYYAKVDELSGGQQKRVALAKALIQPADLLILDEPTNHLDASAIAWLESFLKAYRGALLLVTHDRYFLNRVTDAIFELEHGNLHYYEGNYETYLEKKAEREAQAEQEEEKRKNTLRREMAWLKRMPKARGTKQKARVDRVEALQAETSKQEEGVLDFVSDSKRLGKRVIEAINISKDFGDKKILDDISARVDRGDRIGITGANGTGKSTFLHILAGRLQPDSGVVDIGETVRIGYFTQGEADIDHSLRVLEYIREGAEVITTKNGVTITAEQMLERFLFPRSQQWTYINRLSGGERRRLYLLRILMEEPNVLFLDEPTNNLDIPTLRLLEDYLTQFPGAVVSVSHDRYFLDRVADYLLIFESSGRVERFDGRFEEYLDQKEAAKTDKKPAQKEPRRRPRKKVSYKDQQEWKTIEDTIEQLEQKQSEMEKDMAQAGSDTARVQELLKEQEAVAKELEETMERWTELATVMEEEN
ncbi:ABC-F family ATP-binding cassette domain-containing protein [Salicibibacter cibarius]|uniref:ABC-F family ATP-binding cassette domain-containing protein n=1 Tax=Salicibibacter cibarius TaxID=2743000 RepID=A0A7T6Z635_9BACI|nr:ABC-F family ATP-binding cassette domain-containing protein [Salicibibacter cibarius]QQK77066.1 ABC-F family ATP-binding cassette domain-containing protein [Salicibibacter cibarius]